MPMLQIRLFGHLSLTYGDQPLVLTSARLQALLAYLLLHRTAQPRAHLAYLLWADSSEAKARNSLRFLLHQLRRALPAAERYLEITAHTVQWRTDAPFTLDVLEFERALAAVAAPGAHVRAALERACALYTDDLLTSCYDDWIFGERERLRQLFVAAQEQLVLCCEREGAYADAIRHAQRLLRYDPLHEEAYRRLMQLHALSGDRVGALRVYHTCVAILRRELDVEPGVATQAAYLELLEPPAQTVETRSQPTASSPGGLPNNLPLRLTSFVGRAQAKTELARVLARTRLLTLSGVAGVGKTRLALELAAHLAERSALSGGVWWVDLAALHQPEFVAQTVAAVLDVHEQAGQSSLEALIHFLRDRELLLALDNCEHLVDACAQLVDALLRHCPHVRVMATSREVLNLPAETTFVVSPLTLPAGTFEFTHDPVHGSAAPMPALDAAVGQSEAVRLFVERATAALPTFQLTARNAAAVAQICRRLDGLPLAIELAAARVKLLSVEQLATRLDESLDLLTSGSRSALPRHRTLRAAIDWSYDLLTESERILFRRLSVFRGGFTLQAAEAVTSDGPMPGAGEAWPARGEANTASFAPQDVLELLSHLFDKSLVVVGDVADGEIRYRLLETIHEYARERLDESGEAAALRQRHLAWFLKLVHEAEPHFYAGEQRAGFSQIEREHDNLRAALDWSLDHDVQAGLQLAGMLSRFWFVRGYWHEGLRRCSQLLASPAAAARTAPRAKALGGAGLLAYRLADIAAARSLNEESLAIARETGTPSVAADALDKLGLVAQTQGELALARTLKEQGLALYRELNDQWGIAAVLYSLGHNFLVEGNFPAARDRYEESLRIRRAIDDRRGIAYSLINLGLIAYRQGEFEQARAFYHESLPLMRDIGDKYGIFAALENLGRVAMDVGDIAAARSFLLDSQTLAQETGNKQDIGNALLSLGDVARAEKDFERAKALFQEALKLVRPMDLQTAIADALHNLAQVALAQGDLIRAASLFAESLTIVATSRRYDSVVMCLAGAGELALAAEEQLVAARLFAFCESLLQSPRARLAYLDQRVFARSLVLLRAQLDEATFASVWAEGQALSLDESIAMAQQLLHALSPEQHRP